MNVNFGAYNLKIKLFTNIDYSINRREIYKLRIHAFFIENFNEFDSQNTFDV